MPDLSTIPALAEIFAVSCDELLRGERKSPTERSEISAGNEEASPKGEKQRQRLLKSTLSQYQNLSFIAMGVSLVGLLAALICNLVFLRASLGFLIGAIFLVASIICQTVFINSAFLRVEDAGLDTASLSDYKRKVISLAQKSYGLTAGFIGFTLPMLPVDAYCGLTASSMLLNGSVGAAFFLLIYVIVVYFVNAALLKKGVYTLSEEAAAIYHQNHKWKRKCAIILAALLVPTSLFHVFGVQSLWNPYILSSSCGVSFDDYESFVAYMEKDVPYESDFNNYNGIPSTNAKDQVNSGDTILTEPIEWYDEEGNIITEDEALTETLLDSDGNVVCTYIARNQNVFSIRYTPKEGTVLPIQVISTHDYREAKNRSNLISLIYCILYPTELLVVLFIYFKKKAR